MSQPITRSRLAERFQVLPGGTGTGCELPHATSGLAVRKSAPATSTKFTPEAERSMVLLARSRRLISRKRSRRVDRAEDSRSVDDALSCGIRRVRVVLNFGGQPRVGHSNRTLPAGVR
ncbi:hypothetical protein [Acidihalobacter aeolianus]|uniref:hypothetical protein n=1 Tax=Acidihalobacter aeolianus TaxID=2792603 RepID=UPI0012E9AEA4|nr:hypothetical protein [Acidihalobacter aeolianus]